MNVLVLIQRQSIQIYYPDRDTPVAAMVPLTVLRDLEVLNEKDLDTILSSVLRPVTPKIGMQTMVLIDDAICFSTLLEPGREEEMKKILINDVPFLHTASAIIPQSTGSLFITTNQDLYDSIGRVLESHGYSIIGVYPWLAVLHVEAIKSGEGFGPVAIRRLFDGVASLKQVSFTYHNQLITPVSIPAIDGKKIDKKNYTGWIIFLSIALVYAGFMILKLLSGN